MPHPPLSRLTFSTALARAPRQGGALLARSHSAPASTGRGRRGERLSAVRAHTPERRPAPPSRPPWFREDEVLFAEARGAAGPVNPRDMDPVAAARSRRVAFVTHALREPRAHLGSVSLALRALLPGWRAVAAQPDALDAEPWELIDLPRR